MSEQNANWTNSYSIPVLPKGERLVRLSGLPEQRRREAWQTISLQHPALASLLREPELKAIMEAFDAELFVEAYKVPMLPVEALKGRLPTAD